MTEQRLGHGEKGSVLRAGREPPDSVTVTRSCRAPGPCSAGKRASESKELRYGRAFHLPLCCKAPVEINGAFKYINGLQRHLQ